MEQKPNLKFVLDDIADTYNGTNPTYSHLKLWLKQLCGIKERVYEKLEVFYKEIDIDKQDPAKPLTKKQKQRFLSILDPGLPDEFRSQFGKSLFPFYKPKVTKHARPKPVLHNIKDHIRSADIKVNNNSYRDQLTDDELLQIAILESTLEIPVIDNSTPIKEGKKEVGHEEQLITSKSNDQKVTQTIEALKRQLEMQQTQYKNASPLERQIEKLDERIAEVVQELSDLGVNVDI
jgi:hypothetical protein